MSKEDLKVVPVKENGAQPRMLSRAEMLALGVVIERQKAAEEALNVARGEMAALLQDMGLDPAANYQITNGTITPT